MAKQTQTLKSSKSGHDGDGNELEEEDEEEEMEKLEADVNQMAEKILDYRSTLPDQLRDTLASALVAQRPLLPTRFADGSDLGPSGSSSPVGPAESSKSPPLEEDQETAEKTRLLRHKISSNVSALPVLLKRMKESISRIDNLQSCNEFVHPVFKRKKTS